MNLTIRLAGQADAEVLATLNASAQDLHAANEPRFFKAAEVAEVGHWFGEFLARPTTRAWLAHDDARPIGYATVELKRRQNTPFTLERRWFEVDQVAVLAEYRRRGVATALLKEVLALAKAEAVDDLELSTWHFNSGALEAFAKLGFRPTQQRFSLDLRDRK